MVNSHFCTVYFVKVIQLFQNDWQTLLTFQRHTLEETIHFVGTFYCSTEQLCTFFRLFRPTGRSDSAANTTGFLCSQTMMTYHYRRHLNVLIPTFLVYPDSSSIVYLSKPVLAMSGTAGGLSRMIRVHMRGLAFPQTWYQNDI